MLVLLFCLSLSSTSDHEFIKAVVFCCLGIIVGIQVTHLIIVFARHYYAKCKCNLFASTFDCNMSLTLSACT